VTTDEVASAELPERGVALAEPPPGHPAGVVGPVLLGLSQYWDQVELDVERS
jgi:hypothetical protein